MTTANLIDQINANAESEKAAADEEYRTLVHRADKPFNGDAGRILEVIKLLGISPNDLAKDVEAVRQFRFLKSRDLTHEQMEEQKAPYKAKIPAMDAARRECLANLVRGIPQPDDFYNYNLQWLSRSESSGVQAYQEASAAMREAELQLKGIGVADKENQRAMYKLRQNHRRVLADE